MCCKGFLKVMMFVFNGVIFVSMIVVEFWPFQDFVIQQIFIASIWIFFRIDFIAHIYDFYVLTTFTVKSSFKLSYNNPYQGKIIKAPSPTSVMFPLAKQFIASLNCKMTQCFPLSSSSSLQLAGAAILGVGIWVAVDRVSLLGILENIEDAPPELAQLANIGYVLIGVGAFLTLMGFLGCCGAIKESKCMLLSVSEPISVKCVQLKLLWTLHSQSLATDADKKVNFSTFLLVLQHRAHHLPRGGGSGDSALCLCTFGESWCTAPEQKHIYSEKNWCMIYNLRSKISIKFHK